MISLEQIGALIGAGRYDLTREKACQADIETMLAMSLPVGVAVAREVRLGPWDIPDFMIGGVAVEVKLNGAQPRAVLRQLERYAAHDAVEALILASNRAIALPATIGGKAALFVSLGRAWL